MTISFEVCVDSIESCLEAVKGGASRLELCSSLLLGGLTPSYGMMKAIKDNRQLKNIKIHVMVRPRGGDFLYSDLEFEIMKNDIEMIKSLEFDGVVFGILNHDGSIDLDRTQQLASLSSPLSVTFHRAFDMTRDHRESFNSLLKINKIDRILTSGLSPSVLEGIDVIRDLIQLSKDSSIKILPGGGINQSNITEIVKMTTTDIGNHHHQHQEYHISGRSNIESSMSFRNNKIFMGASRESEYNLSIVDSNKIKDFIYKSNNIN